MTPALEARSVGVRVRAKPLLDDVSLSIAPGETVALIGPNGAGKTTLLRVLAGEIAPSAGVAILKDRDLRRYRPGALAMHRAVLSQHVTVAFPCSVVEVVRMGAGDTRGRVVETKAEEALAEVGLAAMGDRIIGTLSGGEQQRAHLARVLVQLACGEAAFGPGILLLDEPTASLDLCYQLDLLGIVGRRNRQGTTVVSIMHDLNLAVMIATRIVALKGGRIAHDGAATTVMTDDLLRDVFAVADAVNRPPPIAVPYALPQSARRCVSP